MLQGDLGDQGQGEVPEQITQGLVLEKGGENLLMFKSYNQEGAELFYGGMCFQVDPFWAVKHQALKG